MGKATVFDAFQAVTGATQTVLGTLDKEYKAQAAIELQNAQLQNAEAFDGFLMDIQNSGDWENYEKNWESFKAKAYNAGAQNLSSPYARKLYDSQYKEMEMKQRLTVRHAADQKRRLETVTNGYALVNRTAQSSTYVDKEVTLEDGSVYTKTAGEQKMEDIQKTLLTMYDGGLIDYAQLNQHIKEAAANVMLSDMVKEGKAAVDNMENLEAVLQKVGDYKGAYTSVAGDTVTQDMVMDKAKGAAVSYFKEQQQLRYQQSEQAASKIYAELLPALSKGDMDTALQIAQRGLTYIQERDAQCNADGFSAALRDEYVQKFSIFDNIRKAGSGGTNAALARMKKGDIVDYLHFLRINGTTITDENGKKRVEHFSAKQLLDHIRHDVMPKMIAADPENEPLIQAAWGGALLEFVDTLLSSKYSPPGVADYVKDLDKTVENILRLKKTNNWAEMAEGKVQITNTQALVKAQILSRAAEWTVKDGHFNVDGLKKVVEDTIDSVLVKDLRTNSKGKDAARLAEAQSNTMSHGVFDENTETNKSKEQKLQLRNFVIKELQKTHSLREADVLNKYNLSERDDGSVLVTDSKGNPVYMATRHVDKKGKDTYGLQEINITDDGKAYLTQPEKTADEAAQETKDFINKVQSIELYNEESNTFNKVGYTGGFKKRVEHLAPKERALFLEAVEEIREGIKNDKTYKVGSIKDAEKAILALFEQKKNKARL